MNAHPASLLKELCELPGPPGQEHLIRERIAEEISAYCTSLREDPLGNLTAFTGTEQAYTIGILAHMDEVGFVVSRITPGGLISFEMLGSVDDRLLLGREVDIMTDTGALERGVVGNKSRHLQTASDVSQGVNHKELFIDIGARSKAEVTEAGIRIGSGIVFATKCVVKPNGAIIGKALDDRIGCLVLIETLKQCSQLKNIGVYGYFTCQEEIGAKGAAVAAYESAPDLTITLDTVPVKNPDIVKDYDTDIGKGPVIRLADWKPDIKYGMITHPLIRKRLLETAENLGIPYQVDVLTSTYLDSSTVHLTRGGIPGGSICIPRKYSHSPVEVSDMDDIAGTVALLVAFVRSLDAERLVFG
jgi:tetrahedral aminopeptidase